MEEKQIQRYHYIIYDKNNKGDRKESYNYFENLKEWFTLLYQKKDPTLSEKILRYARDLEKAFCAVYEILTYDEKDKLGRLLDKIFILERVGNFYPLLISIWIKDKNQNFHNIERLLKLIEIFSFREFSKIWRFPN